MSLTCIFCLLLSGVTLPVFEHYQEGGDSKYNSSVFCLYVLMGIPCSYRNTVTGTGVLTSFDALPWSCDMEGLLGTLIDTSFLNQ